MEDDLKNFNMEDDLNNIKINLICLSCQPRATKKKLKWKTTKKTQNGRQ